MSAKKHWTQTRKGRKKLAEIQAQLRANRAVRIARDVADAAVPSEPLTNQDYERGFQQGYRSAIGQVLRSLGEIIR